MTIAQRISAIADKSLREFVIGYLEAALWSSTDNDDEPLDANYDLNDISPECFATCLDHCEKFVKVCDRIESETANVWHVFHEYKGFEYAGHDFWLTRNRHGTGFWNRDYGGHECRLTEIAKRFGEIDLYVCDDGLIYC